MPRPVLPPAKGKDADPTVLHQFMEAVFDHDQPLRRIMRSTQNRAAAYYVGKQWLEPIEDGGTGGDQLRGVNWKPLSSDIDGIPMPVQNEIFPEVTREAGLLVGVGSQPYIRPEGDDPDSEDGAKLAKDVLLSRLEELGWLEQQQEGGHDCSLLGTWYQASYWDIDRTKTTRVPVKGAVGCPNEGCDFKLASRELDPEAGQRIAAARPDAVDVIVGAESPNPLIEEPAAKYLATRCATCTTHRGMGPVETGDIDPLTGAPVMMEAETDLPGAPSLEPTVITEEEAKAGKDFVGEPLGEDVALGDTALEVIHPNDAFPDPAKKGLDSKPETWEEFGWETVRSLDWIRARWPNGMEVKPQEGTELWEHHPVVGSVEGLATSIGAGVFDDCALWRLFAKKPFLEKQEGKDDGGKAVWKLNRGRLVIMANTVVLFDGDLMFESLNNPGVFIQRFHFDWVPWERRRRQAHGIGMAEIAFSQQDYINTTKSQWMDSQHRNASPKWVAEDGVTFTYVGGAGSGYDSDFLMFTRDDPTKDAPREFVGQTMDSKFLEAIERDVTSLKRTMMRAEVDSGEPPKGVDAFSALQLLEKKSNEGRKPRSERVRAMKRRVYKHKLELIHEFYREERYYRVRGKNDKWSVKAFRGVDLHHQTNVMFEDEPIIDVGIARRTGIMTGLQVGSITAGTAAANRRINRYLEIPLDINEDENNQVELAETELSEWFKEGVEPFIDEDGDDGIIHWQVHKEELGREERREMKKLCHWTDVLAATWGWKDQLKAIEMVELAPAVPPAETMMARPEEYQQAQEQYQQKVQLAEEIAQMPKPIELRILYLWEKAITGAGIDVALAMNPEAVEALRTISRAEAHAAGHRWIAEKKLAQANAGMAGPAAPGGTQTSTGAIPAAGQTASAPPGGDGAVAGAM